MGQKRILIVDDDANIRKTLSNVLKTKGYETLTAGNGTEGVELLKSLSVDVAIVDLKLPDIYGIEVLSEIKAADPRTEAIILTGNASLNSAIEATNRGAFSYLLKPYEIDQLLLHIRHAIEKREAQEIITARSAELERVNIELARTNAELTKEIAERRQAEETLRQSEERYRLLADNAHDVIWAVDLSGQPTYLSPSVARLTGYTQEEALKKGLEETMTVESVAIARRDIRRIVDTATEGRPVHACTRELKFLHKGGSEVWVEVISGPMFDASGNLVGIQGIARDIAGRKEMENALQAERRKFQALAEDAPFGIVAVDERGRPTFVNAKFKELFGYDLADISDLTTWFLEVLPPRSPGTHIVATWIADPVGLKTGEKQTQTLTVTCRDGSQKIVKFIPVQLSIGEYLLACEDVTEEKHLEEKLQAMSAIDELTGLYNRRGFLALAEQQLKAAARSGKEMLFLFADLDNMKTINDTMGHQSGDRALSETAAALKEAFRGSDIVGRIGGDEFAVLAVEAPDETQSVLVERLRDRLRVRSTPEMKLSLSIGVAHYTPGNPSTLDELMGHADVLMYEEKQQKQSRQM